MLLAADAFADSLDELRVVFESNLGIGIELINPKLHLMECFVFILGSVLALSILYLASRLFISGISIALFDLLSGFYTPYGICYDRYFVPLPK